MYGVFGFEVLRFRRKWGRVREGFVFEVGLKRLGLRVLGGVVFVMRI